MYQSKTHRQPANFINLLYVAFAFERLSCFNKSKQAITHYDCFNVKHEALSVSQLHPCSVTKLISPYHFCRAAFL